MKTNKAHLSRLHSDMHAFLHAGGSGGGRAHTSNGIAPTGQASLKVRDQKSEPTKVVCPVHDHESSVGLPKEKVKNLFSVLFLRFLPESVNDFYHRSTFLSMALWISQSTSLLNSQAR